MKTDRQFSEKLRETLGDQFVLALLALVVGAALFAHFRLRSFFHWQLSRRGIDLIDGFERTLLRASPFQYLAIVNDSKSMRRAGCVGESRVMAAYNKALLEKRREER